MDGTEVMEVEDFGAMATAFRNDDVDALMQMTGQGTVQKEKVGLPRLNINYEAETDDGRPQLAARGRCIMMAGSSTPLT